MESSIRLSSHYRVDVAEDFVQFSDRFSLNGFFCGKEIRFFLVEQGL